MMLASFKNKQTNQQKKAPDEDKEWSNTTNAASRSAKDGRNAAVASIPSQWKFDMIKEKKDKNGTYFQYYRLTLNRVE